MGVLLLINLNKFLPCRWDARLGKYGSSASRRDLYNCMLASCGKKNDIGGCLDHIIAKLIMGKLWKSPTCCKLFNCKTHPMRLQALLHNMAATLLNRESYIVPLEKMAYLACENRVMKFKDVLDNKVPEKKMNSATKSS